MNGKRVILLELGWLNLTTALPMVVPKTATLQVSDAQWALKYILSKITNPATPYETTFIAGLSERSATTDSQENAVVTSPERKTVVLSVFLL
jgi:hypothetical protein